MINNKKHTIGLLQFELHSISEKKAETLQEEISRITKIELPEILESSFNKFDKKGSSFVIDRIEIDLGRIGYDDFKLKLLSIFKKELLQKLELMQVQTPDLLLEGKEIGKEETDFHIVESYLLTGHLPWYSDTSKIDLRQISKKLIRKKSLDFIKLIRLHSTDKNFQTRLGNIIPKNYYKEFFSLFTNRNIWKEGAEFKQYLLLYSHFPFANASINTFRLMLFVTIVEVLSTEFSTESLQLEISVFKKLANKLMISPSQLISKSSHSLERMQVGQGSNEVITQLSLLLHQLEKHFLVNESDKTAKQVEVHEYQTENENDSYLIFNAGLVLVNPFLNELFKKLNLIENGAFINEQAQIKAIHLLQYTATAKTGSPEHILLLNKILCGYPLNEAVPWFVKLNMREKSEATRMITATIKNWTALKKTSVGAFRTSFIQRKGILKKVENRWQLQVERTAYDVLLSRIPWQYEQIKLAWMNTRIETVW